MSYEFDVTIYREKLKIVIKDKKRTELMRKENTNLIL